VIIALQQSGKHPPEHLLVRRAARAQKKPIRAVKWMDDDFLGPQVAWPNTPFLPIGSRSFCLEAFRHQGIRTRPEYPKYPGTLLLRRLQPRRMEVVPLAHLLLQDWPSHGWEVEALDNDIPFPAGTYANREELHAALQTRLPDPETWPTRVSVLQPVRLSSKWRYYVVEGEIRGASRFDAGSDVAPVPDLTLVQEAIARLKRMHQLPAGCALDFGVLMDLRTSLFLGLQDGWALPVYPGSLSPEGYLELLEKRHAQIIQEGKLSLPPLRTREAE